MAWFKKVEEYPPLLHIPTHVAIIMDGNGRWAKKRGLARSVGHRIGIDKLIEIIDECIALKISVLSVYAFSTENWKRDKEEIDAIFLLLEKMIDDSGEVTVDPSTIVQDATHRFLTDAQINKMKEKITIVEKVITIAPGDIIGSEAPYNCVKAVEGLNPSYPAPTIDIKYTNNVFADNEKEEDAYYTIHRCQILAANEATFTFKNKPETAFQVLFQIKVPGID